MILKRRKLTKAGRHLLKHNISEAELEVISGLNSATVWKLYHDRKYQISMQTLLKIDKVVKRAQRIPDEYFL